MSLRAGLLVVAALALSGCGTPFGDDGADGDETRVGEVRRVYDQAVGTSSVVAIPLGTMRFTVSKPGRTVADVTDASEVLGSRHAPDGASLVAVGWTSQVSTGDAALLTTGEREEPTVSLLADGREYRLAGARWFSLGDDSQVVTVRGRPDDLRLRVTYDGYAQTVDVRRPGPTPDQLTGRAGPLYRGAASKRSLRCPEWDDAVKGRRGFVSLSAQCFATAYDPVAYVAGAGWAETGRRWVVVDFSTYGEAGGYWSPDGGPLGASYDVQSAGTVALTLDGRRPDRVVDPTPTPPGSPSPTPSDGFAPVSNLRYVFSLDDHDRPGTLRFSRTYRFVVDRVEMDGLTSNPAHPSLTYAGSVRLR